MKSLREVINTITANTTKMETPSTHPVLGSYIIPKMMEKTAQIATTSKILSSNASLSDYQKEFR